MANSRTKPKAWESRVPMADAVLRKSVVRLTSKRPGSWGYLLAEIRASRGWSQAALAMATGVNESALVFLSVCRSPRQGNLDEDVVAVAGRMGIPTTALWFLLDLVAEAKAGNSSEGPA